MGTVSPFQVSDIPSVADLYWKVFQKRSPPAPQELRDYFSEIFFNNPWYDGGLPSLVYRNDQDVIIGFLGVIQRRMLLNGKSIRVAATHNFMVERQASPLVSVELLKTFLSGPQDLSLADEASSASRRIWERLGGSVALLFSMRWTFPLRPSSYMKFVLIKRRLPGLVDWTLRSLCRFVDALTVRWLPIGVRRRSSEFIEDDLDAGALYSSFMKSATDTALYPEYDPASLNWMIEMAARKKIHGKFKKALLRDASGESIGWYLYYLNPGGVSQVLHLGGKDEAIPDLLDHLFRDAWLGGSTAISGRMIPKFLQVLSDKRCLINRGYNWVLIHSREPALRESIHRGDADISRMDGEWWTHFQEIY